jgi:hypothetical protein
MKYFVRIISMLGVGLVGLLATRSVLASPPLPSSFYGTVKVNGTNVPDGTLIKALINGQAYAEKQTQTIQGDSMYVLNISGDDPETTVVEGGRDGDTIVFSIGGTQAAQTGLWKSGTNIKVSLTASTTSSPPTARIQATQAIATEINPETATANFSLTSVVIGIIAVSILFILCWFILVRKPKALK